MAKMKNTGNKKIKTEGTIVDRSATWQKTFGKLMISIQVEHIHSLGLS